MNKAIWHVSIRKVVKIDTGAVLVMKLQYVPTVPFNNKICYFDKFGDEASGCLSFYCYDRRGDSTVIEHIQAGKSSYVDQWKDYKPSIKQMRFEQYNYNEFVSSSRFQTHSLICEGKCLCIILHSY